MVSFKQKVWIMVTIVHLGLRMRRQFEFRVVIMKLRFVFRRLDLGSKNGLVFKPN